MKCECRYFVSGDAKGQITAAIYDSYVDKIYWNKKLFPPDLDKWLSEHYNTKTLSGLGREGEDFFAYEDIEPVLEQQDYDHEAFFSHDDLEELQKALHKKLVKMMEEHNCEVEKDNARN